LSHGREVGPGLLPCSGAAAAAAPALKPWHHIPWPRSSLVSPPARLRAAGVAPHLHHQYPGKCKPGAAAASLEPQHPQPERRAAHATAVARAPPPRTPGPPRAPPPRLHHAGLHACLAIV
jgi:hypothetical protein